MRKTLYVIALSAPAMFSVSLPLFQNRRYRLDSDGTWRLLSLNYRVDLDDPYADPTLWPAGNWEDHAVHDAEGRSDGFDRLAEKGQLVRLRFGLEGLRRVDATDPPVFLHHLAMPTEFGPLVYVVQTTPSPAQ